MPKLSKDNQFLDLSDYGRPAAIFIANQLKDAKFTPMHLTFMFGICGLLAVFSILKGFYVIAGISLILKSILDAADGELSRLKHTPSFTGRYLDSIFDIIINFLIIITIGLKSNSTFLLSLVAFIGIQLQGTLYNYYYVILRCNTIDGDSTSRIFERKVPKAFYGESQLSVDLTFYLYKILFSVFDNVIYFLDKTAALNKKFPNWFMNLVSLYGLGFQLMIISVMLWLGLIDCIIPFFIYYTVPLVFIVLIRKLFLNN